MERAVKTISVPSTTLDILVEELGYSPSIIKIDVEGAEVQVLNGAAEVLQRYRPIIFMEVTAENFDTVAKLLQVSGYKLFDAVTREPAISDSFNVLAIAPTVHVTAARAANLDG